MKEVTDRYIGMLTDHQVDLQAFILSSLGNYADTMDVLQLTNVVLWKKAGEFRTDAPFLPWALQIAKYEILAFMRKKRREHLLFRPEVIEMMLEVGIERSGGISVRSEALRHCIKELPERSREFLRIRYAQNQSVKQVAEKTGRSIEAVKSLYYRIRLALSSCIDQRVVADSK